MTSSYTQYISGEWRQGSGAQVHQVLDPATGASNGELVHASTKDVDEAIDAAVAAFATWRRTPVTERARMLRKTGEIMRARRTEIGRTITMELGKPIAEATLEVDTAAEMFEWAAEEARRLYGRSIPARAT